MILKDKDLIPTNDPRIKSGDAAEHQMAHYLKREFGKRDDCFVLNDLRLVGEDEEVAQIDHLLVTRFGFFVIESKAGDINVDSRGQWIKVFDGRKTGMPSAMNQAERQGKVLRELIQANREMLRTKYLFGKLQGGFLNALVEGFVAVSDKGIITAEVDIPNLDKADNIPNLIRTRLQALEDKNKLLSMRNLLSTDTAWEITIAETKMVAEFLLAHHQPSSKPDSFVVSTLPDQPEIIKLRANDGSVPSHEGDPCPRCKIGHLVKRTGKKGKSSFFGCSNFPKNKCGYMEGIE
jgi:hypothetical protein